MLRVAEGVADVQICDTGNGYDRTDGSLRYLHFIQTVKFIKLADLYLFLLVRVMMVYHDTLLVYFNRTIIYLAHADAPNIFIIINRADEYLSSGAFITFRGGNGVQNRLEQRRHILWLICQIPHGIAGFGGRIEERTVKLGVGSVQIHEQFQNLVDDLFRTCFRTVDFIDADDYGQVKVKRFSEHKFGLRHGTLESVHQKNDAVYHFQHTLHFAAEICVARRVYDIYFCVFIKNSRIFGQDCDSTFTFKIIGIHDTFRNLLIGAKDAALL